MKNVTLETIYKKVTDLQHDVAQIKKAFWKIPLCQEFILWMKDIDLEKSIKVKDFGKRYGLK